MRRYHGLIGALMLALISGQIAAAPWTAQAQADDSGRPLLLAHYMPWYQTPDVSGYWGWHWTMNHFDPAQGTDGRPDIASHYLPLTGPYDSQDAAVLEYQTLLMKLSGIDGVIVDWYGTEDFRDYAVLNAATSKLFEAVRRAGLRFVICYEDQTLGHMVDEGHITSDQTLQRAQEDMLYLQANQFGDPAYLKHDGQPLLFVFGPQVLRQPSDWETVFAALDVTPALVTLDGHMAFGALASYPWPPMQMAGGVSLAPAALDSYLERFYRNARRQDVIVGSAFPAFHDIYQQAGVRSSYGYIDPQNGETLRHTLDLALAADPQIVQLVTWNDYGEGTIIEPTEEFGYQYLEIVQTTRRTLQADFAPTADDLRLPLALFQLRKAHAGDVAVNAELDRAYDALIAGDTAAAAAIIDRIQP
ncbi:MAG: glycoside hydrolase family 99-like domain-containing protein [Anaerolineae bacterium]|nr:glycoside hydrolase family 99-like domain-containing protein [Anaerolineae bacterium]